MYFFALLSFMEEKNTDDPTNEKMRSVLGSLAELPIQSHQIRSNADALNNLS